MPTRDGVPAPSRGLCAWYQGLLWTAAGVWWPFLFPLIARRGVGFARLGLLVAVWPATALLAQPLAGWLCDRSGRTRVVQCLLSLGAAAVLPLFGIVSGLAPELAVVVAFALLNAPSVPLADALTVAQLQRVGGDYGGVRLWGSGGFAVAGIAAGLAVHLRWIQPSGLLVVGAVLTVPVALLALAFPADVRGLAPRTPAGAVLQARPLLTLLGLFALVLVPMNAHSTYFSLYLAHLGGGAIFQGAGWALPALVEVPFFLWGAAAAAPPRRAAHPRRRLRLPGRVPGRRRAGGEPVGGDRGCAAAGTGVRPLLRGRGAGRRPPGAARPARQWPGVAVGQLLRCRQRRGQPWRGLGCRRPGTGRAVSGHGRLVVGGNPGLCPAGAADGPPGRRGGRNLVARSLRSGANRARVGTWPVRLE